MERNARKSDRATFTATQNRVSNCTETIAMSFQFMEPSLLHDIGEIVPGTMNVSASGFLGSFYSGGRFFGLCAFLELSAFIGGR